MTLATDPSKNNYARHSIRTGVAGFVWFARFREAPRLALGVPGLRVRWLEPTKTSRLG